MIKPFKLTLRFLSPAFLGNAEQSAEFRTPPIKAQLRHFWRMVQASHGVQNIDTLRQREHELFGSAAGTTGHKSLVRLRLNNWEAGRLSDWGGLATRQISVGQNNVSAALYLGFGPLTYEQSLKKPKLTHPPAIAANAHAILQLAVVPHQHETTAIVEHHRDISQALRLMHRFGTLGGRSRNGWGSYELDGLDKAALENDCLIDWLDALDQEWPCGLGKDDRALLWQSRQVFDSWEGAMIELAQVRANANRAGGDRTLLSWPVTKQSHTGWTNKDRLPSSLHFKVISAEDQGFRAQVTHFPCQPNDDLRKRGKVQRQALVDSWSKVHSQLDRNPQFERAEISK